MTVTDGEMEETLVALMVHRTKEVNHLRTRVEYYQSKLDLAVSDLDKTHQQLARIRTTRPPSSSSSSRVLAIENNNNNNVQNEEEEEECKPFKKRPKPLEEDDDCKIVEKKKKPLLIIPPRVTPFPINIKQKKIIEGSHDLSLIEMVCTSSSPRKIKINCQPSTNMIPSQHTRKLRSLVLSPTNHKQFATSALDGIVNLWEIQAKGSDANLVRSINAASTPRRWPEDIAWHPHGNSLISVYTADSGQSQLAVLNFNNKEKEVVYLEDKPHTKGVINNVTFMPWGDTCFSTCGNDHLVVLWTSKHGSWKPTTLHATLHSSAVMGVAGMQQKRIVISVGADKRIIGFDVESQTATYKHLIDSKCMSVLPNPRDSNLFMIQTGSPQRQLRLFDMRLKASQVHEFGWNQESSTSQSALINQAWSPDGLYLTSGSADPMIHIFDIRYNGSQPSQFIKAHKKRVFKAAWHQSLPLLISISSDLNIGLHNI